MSNASFVQASSFGSYGAVSTVWCFGEEARRSAPESHTRLEDPGFEASRLLQDRFGLGISGRGVSGEARLEIPACPPADWILPWWNADVSGSGRLEVFLRFGVAQGWSAWYPLGLWAARSSSFEAADEAAEVKTDTLFLNGLAGRVQARLLLSAGEEPGSVFLRRFGLVTREKARKAPPTKAYFLKEGNLKVPPRSQMFEAPEIRGRICSPTCCAMALSFLGLDYPTAQVAVDCLDSGSGIYGNWPFNVASLWRLGARARLGFFPNLEAAAGELLGGKPLIVSVRFGEGELSGAPISKTSGHLILLRGIEKGGDGRTRVLVNDPASKDLPGVPRAYLLEEFERAWTGVAYVIEGRR